MAEWSVVNETTTTQDDKKLQRRAIGLAVSAAVGGFLFGFDSSVINGAVSAIQGRFELSETLIGFAVASALLGCALGAYLAGRIADRIGRRWTMIIGAGFFFISAFGSGYAFSVWDLTIWRVIGGLGIGIASVVAPAYIAEISPKLLRGRLASLQQLAITLGIFTALLSDAVFAGAAGSASAEFWFGLEAWRWMLLVCAIPAVIYGVLAYRLPESRASWSRRAARTRRRRSSRASGSRRTSTARAATSSARSRRTASPSAPERSAGTSSASRASSGSASSCPCSSSSSEST
ncbi:D-xylose-proton symporter [Clavibacter michiganensis subsp. michiganensis]|nr:D-xylose-proton symporter [Clavibacter michiganensis subsp. michiganensis]